MILEVKTLPPSLFARAGKRLADLLGVFFCPRYLFLLKEGANVAQEKRITKMDLFCEEYLVDLNGKQAAIRAGYSPHTAEQQASRLLTNVKVRARIDKALAQRAKRTGINQDRVVRELARVAFVNAADVINFDEATIKDGAEKDDTAAIASVKVKTIPGEDGDGVEREIKLNDKLKALELLGKHLGMWNDKPELNLPVQVVINYDYGDDEDSGN